MRFVNDFIGEAEPQIARSMVPRTLIAGSLATDAPKCLRSLFSLQPLMV